MVKKNWLKYLKLDIDHKWYLKCIWFCFPYLKNLTNTNLCKLPLILSDFWTSLFFYHNLRDVRTSTSGQTNILFITCAWQIINRRGLARTLRRLRFLVRLRRMFRINSTIAMLVGWCLVNIRILSWRRFLIMVRLVSLCPLYALIFVIWWHGSLVRFGSIRTGRVIQLLSSTEKNNNWIRRLKMQMCTRY